jgi:hypothetical protein
MQKEWWELVIVYHGSTQEIIKIDLSKAMPGKDFGRGFYVTTIKEQAEKWASHRAKDGSSGIVSGFKFEHENAFSSPFYKTLRFDGYNECGEHCTIPRLPTNNDNNTFTPLSFSGSFNFLE